MVSPRPFIDKTHPEIYRAMVKTSSVTKEARKAAGLSGAIVELVNMRVSQINGCVMCLSIHAKEARKEGVEQLKLDVLAAWHEAEIFDDQERAALMIAESITILDPAEDRDVTFEFAKKFFTEEQVATLEWVAIVIGAFNRISIASGHQPAKAKVS